MTKIKTGRYLHFKGDEIKVFGLALHSETMEESVVYKHTTGDKAGEENFWIRPVSMFLESVEKDGQQRPRFEYLGE